MHTIAMFECGTCSAASTNVKAKAKVASKTIPTSTSSGNQPLVHGCRSRDHFRVVINTFFFWFQLDVVKAGQQLHLLALQGRSGHWLNLNGLDLHRQLVIGLHHDPWRFRRWRSLFKLIEHHFFYRWNVSRLCTRKSNDLGRLGPAHHRLDHVLRDHNLMKALRRRRHPAVVGFSAKGMRTIGREIQLHGIWINWPAPACAMLLHPRNDFSSPCRIGRRPHIARNGTNCWHWRRNRLVIIRKIGCKNVVVRLMVNQGRGVPASVDARSRLTAERASHGPVRRFSPGAGGIRLGQGFAFTKLAVVTCPDWLSTACVPNISLLSQQDCFVTCLSPRH